MNDASPVLVTARCSHRSPSGRRCRKLASDANSGLCPRHLGLEKQSDTADLTRPLLTGWQGFQTAQGVNLTLGNLYRLLAANRISARRAAVLAYISSLILRTHPSIDADRDNGIDAPEAFAKEPSPIEEPSRQTLGEQAAVRALTPDSRQPESPADSAAQPRF